MIETEMIAAPAKLPKVHVPEGGKPVKVWAESIEDGAMTQADNLARLPFVISHVALMPDAHQGYGMPIGGVLFAERAIVPYAIGVDIGCGVVLARTDLFVEEVQQSLDTILARILELVPVGNGPQAQFKTPRDLSDLGEIPGSVDTAWVENAAPQLGTLGGGNHFIELQQDSGGHVYVMLHSGSRSLGKKICDHFAKEALRLNQMWYSDLPDKELAYLPQGERTFTLYWDAINYALRFAEVNRERMLIAAQRALMESCNVGAWEVIVDCHHNYAQWENHKGHNGIVHRKGAVQARAGQDVLIPGSMGAASYWARGLGNPESFETCQHGAGRAMSRGAAKRAFNLDEMQRRMTKAGTKVLAPNISDVLDEAPWAYKDVDTVMAESSDLVEVVERLTPIGTVKG